MDSSNVYKPFILRGLRVLPEVKNRTIYLNVSPLLGEEEERPASQQPEARH